jgi:hypothetical protein
MRAFFRRLANSAFSWMPATIPRARLSRVLRPVPPGYGNNVQDRVECLLSGGAVWQIELPVHWLWREHRASLERLCAHTRDRPAAFWIRRLTERTN